MNGDRSRRVARLPRGLWTSIVVGMTASACGWLLSSALPALTASYVRLDQLTALVLGATIGGGVIGVREYRQRRSVSFGVAAGAVLGGVGALSGASLVAFASGMGTPRFFAVERIAAWLLSAAAAGALLSTIGGTRPFQWIREIVLIAAIGGGVSGIIFTLPGAADVWQAVACIWFGGAIALAVTGPELWHANAVVELVPARGTRWNPILGREWPLYDGAALSLGEAQVACQNGRVTLYPPSGGLIANGHTVREPQFLHGDTLISIGRTRYRLDLFRCA